MSREPAIRISVAPELAPDPHVAACLQRFAHGEAGGEAGLPWVSRLSPREQGWLRSDLALVLAEPESTGEPLDWHELTEILREAAVLAEWEGALLLPPPPEAPEQAYTVDLRPDDLRALEAAPLAVQRALRDLRERFLPMHPTSAARLERGRLKKLTNRDLWQVDLPDGYRLRYFVAEPERMVYVVYLGPHPDGAAAGREQAVRARVQRQRHGG